MASRDRSLLQQYKKSKEKLIDENAIINVFIVVLELTGRFLVSADVNLRSSNSKSAMSKNNSALNTLLEVLINISEWRHLVAK